MDCRICGACCFGGDWVPVDAIDDVPDDKTVPGDKFYSAFMRMRCVCLKGNKRFSCSIYADRPSACRDLEPGSVMCLEKRREIYGDNLPSAGSP